MIAYKIRRLIKDLVNIENNKGYTEKEFCITKQGSSGIYQYNIIYAVYAD